MFSSPLRWHDLPHTYASLLIAAGLNVVYVAGQLGHASASITLDVYGRLRGGGSTASGRTPR